MSSAPLSLTVSRTQLRTRKHLYHTLIGVSQLIFGSVMFIFEVIGLVLRPVLQFSFILVVGLWAGCVFNFAGIIALILTCGGPRSKQTTRYVLTAAAVASSVAFVIAISAFVCVSMEFVSLRNKLGVYRGYHPMVDRIFHFAYAKLTVQLTACGAEAIAAGVHVVLCAYTLCRVPEPAAPTCRWRHEEVYSVPPAVCSVTLPPPYDHPLHEAPPAYTETEHEVKQQDDTTTL